MFSLGSGVVAKGGQRYPACPDPERSQFMWAGNLQMEPGVESMGQLPDKLDPAGEDLRGNPGRQRETPDDGLQFREPSSQAPDNAQADAKPAFQLERRNARIDLSGDKPDIGQKPAHDREQARGEDIESHST